MEETTIIEETVPTPEHSLVLTPEAQYYLNEGAGWAKFLGIMGFVGSGFIIIIAFSLGAIFNMLSKFSPNPTAFPAGLGVFMGIIYALLALVYFFPSLYIYQFGINAKKGILVREPADITLAVTKLKSFLKFWGILMIIGMAFGILGFLGMITNLSHLARQ